MTDNWICCQATGRLNPGEFVLKGVKGYMSRGHCCFRPILCSVFTLTQNASVDKFIKQFSFGNTGQNNFGGAFFAGIGLKLKIVSPLTHAHRCHPLQQIAWAGNNFNAYIIP